MTSTGCRGSSQVSFAFSSIAAGLAGYPGFSGSLAGLNFYVQSFLVDPANSATGYVGNYYALTSANATTAAMLGNPNFIQWANISCSLSCVCTVVASGYAAGSSGTVSGLSGSGCTAQSWYVNNPWTAGNSYM